MALVPVMTAHAEDISTVAISCAFGGYIGMMIGLLWAIWMMRAKRPNDPKLSDSPGWRDRCAVGERRRQEAAGVTAGRVRCSAWLGVAVIAFILRKSTFRMRCLEPDEAPMANGKTTPALVSW